MLDDSDILADFLVARVYKHCRFHFRTQPTLLNLRQTYKEIVFQVWGRKIEFFSGYINSYLFGRISIPAVIATDWLALHASRIS